MYAERIHVEVKRRRVFARWPQMTRILNEWSSVIRLPAKFDSSSSETIGLLTLFSDSIHLFIAGIEDPVRSPRARMHSLMSPIVAILMIGRFRLCSCFDYGKKREGRWLSSSLLETRSQRDNLLAVITAYISILAQGGKNNSHPKINSMILLNFVSLHLWYRCSNVIIISSSRYIIKTTTTLFFNQSSTLKMMLHSRSIN